MAAGGPTPASTWALRRAGTTAERQKGIRGRAPRTPEDDGEPTETRLARARQRRARILIVEDNVLNRLLIHDSSSCAVTRCVEAATVDEARRALDAGRLGSPAARRPDSGRRRRSRDSTRTRRAPSFAELPIVAVTSLAMPGDRERLLGSGFQGYLSKPIDTRTFGAIVESFLKNATPARSHCVSVASVDARAPPSWWSTTTSRIGRWPRGIWSGPGTRSFRPRAAPRRWRCWRPGGPIWCCSTCSCRGWTAYETCRRIRALPPEIGDTPVLFLTALGDLETHKAALESGADDFLTKPLNRTELLIRVRSLLRIKQISDELRSQRPR